jgi:hypothetical protein
MLRVILGMIIQFPVEHQLSIQVEKELLEEGREIAFLELGDEEVLRGTFLDTVEDAFELVPDDLLEVIKTLACLIDAELSHHGLEIEVNLAKALIQRIHFD